LEIKVAEVRAKENNDVAVNLELRHGRTWEAGLRTIQSIDLLVKSEENLMRELDGCL
jgi:hypothetical protein